MPREPRAAWALLEPLRPTGWPRMGSISWKQNRSLEAVHTEPRTGDRLPSPGIRVLSLFCWAQSPRRARLTRRPGHHISSCPASPGGASAPGSASSQSWAQRLLPWSLLGPWPCQVCLPAPGRPPPRPWPPQWPRRCTACGRLAVCPWPHEPLTGTPRPLCMAPGPAAPALFWPQGGWRLPLLSSLPGLHGLDWLPGPTDTPQTLSEVGTDEVAGLSRIGDSREARPAGAPGKAL